MLSSKKPSFLHPDRPESADEEDAKMKTLTETGLKRRIKNWKAHREEVMDFYVRTADEPTKRMIRRTLREHGCRVPKYIFERVVQRILRDWGLLG